MHIKIFICTYIDLMVCLCAAIRMVHVRRAPDDLPLKAIARCTVCIALALVLVHPGVYSWLLIATRGVNVPVTFVICMASAFWLLRFFHLSAAGPEADWSQTLAVLCLVLFASAATVVWATSPVALRASPPKWLNRDDGSAAVFVLVVSGYIGGVAAMAMRWSLVYSVVTIRRHLRMVLRILSVALVAGLCACVFKVLSLAAQLVFTVDADALNTIWSVIALFGVWTLVAGVTHPVTVEVVGRVVSVFARRAVFRELGPLWRALHDAFPELTLPRTSEWWWTRGAYVWPWRARAYYRRVIEIRDGLVRLTPYCALGVEHAARAAGTAKGLEGRDLDLHTGAAVVAAALERRGRDAPSGERCAVPDGGGHDLDSDARWLVSLSRALTTVEPSGKLPADSAEPHVQTAGSARDATGTIRGARRGAAVDGGPGEAAAVPHLRARAEHGVSAGGSPVKSEDDSTSTTHGRERPVVGGESGAARHWHQLAGDFAQCLNDLFASVTRQGDNGRTQPYSTPYVARKITEDLSHETTVSRVYLAGLRSGRNSNPTIAVVKAIAKFFDERRTPGMPPITAAYLLGVEEVEEAEELERKLADRQVRTIAMRAGEMTPAMRSQLLQMLDALGDQALLSAPERD